MKTIYRLTSSVSAYQAGTWDINSITNDVNVTATDFDIRNLTKTNDEIYGVLRTDGGVAYDARDRNWTITETVTVDATDLDIRDLSKTNDEIYSVLRTDAGTAYDARDRNWNLSSANDSVAAVQSGTWNINSITNSVNIEGGNTNDVKITLDGEVVRINDNGGSITVDGTITANQGGTWNINNISGTISLPTGASTSAKQDTMITSLGIMDDWDNANSDGCSVSGDVAHDTTDAGEPIKTGGKAIDYEPDTEGFQGANEVGAGDRVNQAFNRRGEIIEGVNTAVFKFDGGGYGILNGQYDDAGTNERTTNAIECWNYRYATFGFALQSVNAGSPPTTITISVEVSADGTHWQKMMNGGLGNWVYDDQICSTEIERAFTFPICAYKMRIKIKSVGGNASNYFTISDSCLMLRN